MTTDFTGPRRFNHVAMTVPADRLDEQGRADLCEFYGAVFGWQELPTMTIDRARLVMSVHTWDQFVFLVASDQPMSSSGREHFGLAVDSLDELHEVLRRAELRAATDDRVEIIGYEVEDHEVLLLHSFYVSFVLPMMVEVQFFEVVGR